MSIFDSLWERHAEEQTGYEKDSSEESSHADNAEDVHVAERKKNYAEELYLDMTSQADNNEQMLKQLQEIKRKAISYIDKRNELKKVAKDSRDGGIMAGKEGISDTEQRIIHNAPIDNLNIYSRMCVKYGKSNAWRAKLGEDRNVIADWAIKSYDLIKKDLKNEGDTDF